MVKNSAPRPAFCPFSSSPSPNNDLNLWSTTTLFRLRFGLRKRGSDLRRAKRGSDMGQIMFPKIVHSHCDDRGALLTKLQTKQTCQRCHPSNALVARGDVLNNVSVLFSRYRTMRSKAAVETDVPCARVVLETFQLVNLLIFQPSAGLVFEPVDFSCSPSSLFFVLLSPPVDILPSVRCDTYLRRRCI